MPTAETTQTAFELPIITAAKAARVRQEHAEALAPSPEEKAQPVDKQEKPVVEDKAKSVVSETAAVIKADDPAKADAEKPAEKKELSVEEKRIKDTRDALTKERKTNLELQGRLDTINKKLEEVTQKLDGTFDEKKTPKKSEEQIRAEANQDAKIKASEIQAKKQFGNEEVTAKITEKDSPYQLLERDKPWLGMRCAMSDEPIVEAMRVMKEEDLFTQYGTRDLSVLVERIRTETIEKEKDNIVKLATEQLQGKKPKDVTKGLGDVRGASGVGDGKVLTPAPNLSKIFPWAPSPHKGVPH